MIGREGGREEEGRGREGGREGRTRRYLELELGQMLQDAHRALFHGLGEGDERLAHGPREADGHIREGFDATDEDEAGLVAEDLFYGKEGRREGWREGGK
eukprot:evm.model.NODE_22593_length_10817_cov_14.875751.1